MLVLLVAGVGVRLIWLAIGYWRLHRYRRDAGPLDAEIAAPQEDLASVRKWESLPRSPYQSHSAFGGPPCCCRHVGSIWILGAVPPSFRHELLHVRRNDWAFHAAEEVIRALVRFHPAVWWLIAEIRLAREQVVDRLVVGLTCAPKPYAEVLLAFAGLDSRITAPAFVHKRHLARRIQSILQEVTMTRSRLLVSFASITLCLVVAGAMAVWSFPLESVRSNLIVQGGPAAGVIGGVIGGTPAAYRAGVIGGVVGGVPASAWSLRGRRVHGCTKLGDGVSAPQVVHKVDPKYTKEGRDAKIEGAVVVQTEIHTDGRAHNMRVERSVDPGLDHKALDAISQWTFAARPKRTGSRWRVDATIEINLQAALTATLASDIAGGKTSGSLHAFMSFKYAGNRPPQHAAVEDMSHQHGAVRTIEVHHRIHVRSTRQSNDRKNQPVP